jgi:serine/threonine protein phosphatase 1
MSGRLLAIGDVHGCHRALTTLLGIVGICATDTVVFLGDLVDRGPSTKEVIQEVLSLQKTCRVVLLMGNHEEMMRDCLSGRGMMRVWLDSGGRQTVTSYGSIDDIPPQHIRLLLSAEPFWETEKEIFVHASLEPDVSLRNQTSEYLRWKHLGGSERPHVSGKRVICGHTPQKDGIPLVLRGRVCIDTFACGGKYFTCLDVASDQVFQASELGATREFPLSRYS